MDPIRALVKSTAFNNTVLVVIVFNAAVIGVGTYLPKDDAIVNTIEWICVAFFSVELILRFLARESTRAHFRDPWNIFDIVVVVSAFIPQLPNVTTVLRVLRLFRVLRLVRAIPELRIIVEVLIRSLSSMAYIGMLMILCFYIYAVFAVEMFGDNQPEYSSLHEAFFSLFRSLTAEDWTNLRYEGLAPREISVTEGFLDNLGPEYRSGGRWWRVTLFHVSWMLLSTYLIINLVIGAILSNYQNVEQEEKLRQANVDTSEKRLLELVDEINTLLKQRVHNEVKAADKHS